MIEYFYHQHTIVQNVFFDSFNDDELCFNAKIMTVWAPMLFRDLFDHEYLVI